MKFKGVEVVKVEEGPRISKEERTQHQSDNHHIYAMRHSEDDWSLPVTIERGVMVNYWGYMITKEPLELTDSNSLGSDPSFIELTEDEGYDLVDMCS